ncbi:NAD-dependent glutamate dehydrogenase [Modicella reniformis]|uniref:NAD-specific glutamate dehydrogenase n=1 Tax=Modicella reniformis TaxID=1440133 RepID=A0A9P6LUH8_9FUNG|nr:NAD-dependent glutamate dehydrogenase [Modicella reniformis]
MTSAAANVAAQNGHPHTLKDMPGYIENAFPGKEAQMVQVTEYMSEKGFIPADLAQNEVSWFYGNLGIDDMYFATESVESIANHIMALYGAKIFAYTKNDNGLDINLERETDEAAVYIHTSRPGVSQLYGPQHEKRIDAKYFDLRTYFVRQCVFVNPKPTKEQEIDIRETADKSFLEKATENTLEIYSNVMKMALSRTGPVIEMFEVEGSRERRLVIAYKQQTTQSFFSAISDLYHYYDLYSTRKYVEQFSNGITIISLYLNQIPKSTAPPIEHSIHQIIKEASLIYCLPTTPLQSFFQTNKLSVQESIYGYIGWIFAQHFLNRLGNEYVSLVNILDPSNSNHQDVLTKMKKRLRTDTFTRDYILEIIKSYPELIKLLYINFAMIHYVNPALNSLQPTLSYQRLRTDNILTVEELHEKIRRTTSNSHELMVFESFLIFNKHVLKTNFYQPTKVALSFRMDPAFLPEIEYPTKLFGMFLVIGSEFRGFHLRFRDVARGGIRIIRSRNNEAYSINLRSLFDENYALANTQQRKNKDIPEGGSKGTILLDVNQQDKALVAFEKYVDAMLDLLILGETPGIKERIVDLYKKPEILFFGPDEGTADYMDWASAHARVRGASFWKAFTTGKSQSLGGIPHDIYGMTTRSVHQYVLGIYRKLGMKEENCRKLQTGGPDGDLGSNEIKISKDKTCGIVDGSGVLYDPEGIDRPELTRLASNRLMISNFDVSKLSPKGFRVLVDEMNVKLPSGETIDDGLSFRNNFHLNSMVECEMFVPCGGRPEAVDLQNVSRLLDNENHTRFKYIVEGANLFFTQEARLRLERAGAVVFKDASANKGGVTSSSLEVLAALAFTDEEFAEHMQFEALWKEHQRTRTPRSILSDELSLAIVKLNENLQHTSLWDNVPLRKVVLEEAFPNMLLKQVGLETLMKRVPENYVRAIFGSYLASRFVYKYGTEPSQFAFFEFMTPYFSKVQ